MRVFRSVARLAAVLVVGGGCTLAWCQESAASENEKVLIPHASWTCGMAEGIPVPERGTLILSAEVQLGQTYDVGKTPYGQRKVIVTGEGTASGEKLQAKVLFGGLDFQLIVPNGVVEVEQILTLSTSDGKYILARNVGTGMTASDVRMVFDFEAPNDSPFAWLNSGKFVGRRTVDASQKTLTLSIYDVSAVAPAENDANSVRIEKPPEVPPQPWDYRRAAPNEQRGEEIVTEIVTLGGGQRVGASKRGNRNIIPITGGTVRGAITGNVLFGGADYQNFTNGPAIDARYLWQTTDGDIIIVRNTGPLGSLVPTFETRVDGNHAWVNSGTYLSSNPGRGAGGLSITMYRSVQPNAP